MIKRWIRLAGTLLALAAMLSIVLEFARGGTWRQVIDSPYAGDLLLLALAGAPVYLVGLVAAGVAWWSAQSAYVTARPPLRPFFAVYAVTQFAKYLPSNVGHYVARHVLLRRYGVAHSALLMGTLTEAGFMVLAALVWSAAYLDVLIPRLGVRISAGEMLLLAVLFIVAAISILQALRKCVPRLAELIPLCVPLRLVTVLPLHLLLFGMMALALMLAAQALPAASQIMFLLPGAAAASWVAGFLVIGAPAGIGVREAVFFALLRQQMPVSDILLLAAAFRIATFGGDVLFFLLGLALGGARLKPMALPEPAHGHTTPHVER